MLRMTDRSGQHHLRFVTIGAVDLHDVGYQCHAVFGDVVEDVPRTETRRSLRPLRRATPVPTENTSVQFVRISLAAKYFTAGFLRPCRAVSRRCGDERRQRLTLSHHSFEVCGYDLGAHVPFDDVADFNIMTFAVFRTPDVLFGHQRWVGRYAVQDAQFVRLLRICSRLAVSIKNFMIQVIFYDFLKIRKFCYGRVVQYPIFNRMAILCIEVLFSAKTAMAFHHSRKLSGLSASFPLRVLRKQKRPENPMFAGSDRVSVVDNEGE